MPREHPPEFTALNVFTAQPDPYIWLIEMQNPDGGPMNDIGGGLVTPRFTPNSEPVAFAGKVYDPYAVKLDGFDREATSTVASMTMTLSNAAQFVVRLLELNDFFHDHRVILSLVHSALLGNPSAVSSIITTVLDVTSNWSQVDLTLSGFDQTAFSLPQPLILDKCRFSYRHEGCLFTGDQPGTWVISQTDSGAYTITTVNEDLGSCPKTLSACRLRGQWMIDHDPGTLNFIDSNWPRFFGGFPGAVSGKGFGPGGN